MALVPLSPPFNTQALNADGLHSDMWEAHHQDVVDQLNIIANTMHRGVTDGSDAAAGEVGEYLTASATGVALVSNVPINVVSLDLTAGDWDVAGNAQISSPGGTRNIFGAGLDGIDTQISATFPTTGTTVNGINAALKRYNVTAATTVWLQALGSFSGSATASGTIRARRAR
jgi:hypothetical protein